MFSCGLLRPQSSNGLLKNFRDFLSLEKKLETLQQDLYEYIFAGSSTETYDCITLVRKGLLSFFKTEKADPDLLLPCVLASGVPVKDIKTIKSNNFWGITTSDWESFDILTREGAVIQKVEANATYYSPVIQEMMRQRKLLKLR